MSDATPKVPDQDDSLDMQIANIREKLKSNFKDLHSLLIDKVLKKNKSVGKLNIEKSIVDTLIKTCMSLEKVNVGEGTTSMVIIGIRELLTLRDRINEVEYDVALIKRRLDKLEGK